MAADLRLVVDAAQRQTQIFLIERLGNGVPDGRLAGPGRTDQAEDRARALLRQLEYGQIFQDPLLDLFQPVVVALEDLLRAGEVLAVLPGLVPGHRKKGLDIAPEDRSLGGLRIQRSEAADLPLDPVFDFIRSLKCAAGFPETVHVGKRGVVPQLLPDRLQLFPENVFLLILIKAFLDLLLQFAADPLHLRFAGQDHAERLEPLADSHRFEKGLPFFPGERQVHGDLIDHLSDLAVLQDLRGDLFAQIPRFFRVILEIPGEGPKHGFLRERPAKRLLLQIKGHHLGVEIRRLAQKGRYFRPFDALDQDTEHLFRELHHLLDPGDGTDPEKAGRFRILFSRIPLGNEKDLLRPDHRPLNGADGFFPLNIKMHQHPGQHHGSPERHRRKDRNRTFAQIMPLFSAPSGLRSPPPLLL